MTSPAIERFSQFVIGEFTWERADIDIPGRCDRFGWCDGDCKPLPHLHLGDVHTRYIASALRTNNDLVEIKVGQWKADPAKPWYLGGSGGGYANKDRKPDIGIFAFPGDLVERKDVYLSMADADAMASALRLIGADPFASALEAAVTFARKLEEQS